MELKPWTRPRPRGAHRETDERTPARIAGFECASACESELERTAAEDAIPSKICATHLPVASGSRNFRHPEPKALKIVPTMRSPRARGSENRVILTITRAGWCYPPSYLRGGPGGRASSGFGDEGSSLGCRGTRVFVGVRRVGTRR